MVSALASVHTVRGELICKSFIGVTHPPRNGSRNLDQHSPSFCIPLHELLCGCYSGDAIIALLLAGVHTVGGLCSQCRDVTLPVSLFIKTLCVWVTSTRTIKCEFQCVLCTVWPFHHDCVLLYALSGEQLICCIITTDNVVEKCYPIYGDMSWN